MPVKYFIIEIWGLIKTFYPLLLIAVLVIGYVAVKSRIVYNKQSRWLRENFEKLGVTIKKTTRRKVLGEYRGSKFLFYLIDAYTQDLDPLRAYTKIYFNQPLQLGLACYNAPGITKDILETPFVGFRKKIILPYLEQLGLICYAKDHARAQAIFSRDEVEKSITRLWKLMILRELDETLVIDDKKICIYYRPYSQDNCANRPVMPASLEFTVYHLPRKEGLEAMADLSAILSKETGGSFPLPNIIQ